MLENDELAVAFRMWGRSTIRCDFPGVIVNHREVLQGVRGSMTPQIINAYGALPLALIFEDYLNPDEKLVRVSVRDRMTQPRCAFGLKRFYNTEIAAKTRRESSAETVVRRHRDDFAHTQKVKIRAPREILSRSRARVILGSIGARSRVHIIFLQFLESPNFHFLCVREIVTMTTHHGFRA